MKYLQTLQLRSPQLCIPNISLSSSVKSKSGRGGSVGEGGEVGIMGEKGVVGLVFVVGVVGEVGEVGVVLGLEFEIGLWVG